MATNESNGAVSFALLKWSLLSHNLSSAPFLLKNFIDALFLNGNNRTTSWQFPILTCCQALITHLRVSVLLYGGLQNTLPFQGSFSALPVKLPNLAGTAGSKVKWNSWLSSSITSSGVLCL